ncbi:MAG: DUF2304 domain-containing protein [Lachnospiraceae bacterium]|nr:DUF2304 domain-containing protein [Lachnospiraceae bacterium]
MAVGLRIILIAFSVLALIYIIGKIRHSRMQIEYALFWILLSIVFILMAVFPELVYGVCKLLGIMSPANFVYLFIIAILLLKVFMMTVELSALENKVKDLVQQQGIAEKTRSEEEKRVRCDKQEVN